MYLYYKGERYFLQRDNSYKGKREAVYEILAALNGMKATRDMIEQIAPMAFHTKHETLDTEWVGLHLWLHLEKVITRQKRVTGSYLKEVHPTSIQIFKEMYFYLQKEEWIYTIDYSYQHILKRQFFIVPPEELPRKPLLVPKSFLWVNLLTCVTDEHIFNDGQDIPTLLSDENV